MKMYRGEFPVAEESVTITAGTNATKDIQSTEKKTSLIWRVGNLDGKPLELKNGDRIERMHPDDVRSIPWGGNITLGYSSSGEFPMALFAKVGGTGTINFNLAADQVVDVVLRVSTTLSFKGGRPSVKMNDWEGKDPGAPVSTKRVARSSHRNILDKGEKNNKKKKLKATNSTLLRNSSILEASREELTEDTARCIAGISQQAPCARDGMP